MGFSLKKSFRKLGNSVKKTVRDPSRLVSKLNPQTALQTLTLDPKKQLERLAIGGGIGAGVAFAPGIMSFAKGMAGSPFVKDLGQRLMSKQSAAEPIVEEPVSYEVPQMLQQMQGGTSSSAYPSARAAAALGVGGTTATQCAAIPLDGAFDPIALSVGLLFMSAAAFAGWLWKRSKS